MAKFRTMKAGSKAARAVLANPRYRPATCGAGCPYRGQRHVHRVALNPCPHNPPKHEAYCWKCLGGGKSLGVFSSKKKAAISATSHLGSTGHATSVLSKNNPPAVETLIYPRVEKIFAVKPDGQQYVHEMESGDTEPPYTGSARAYGLANGDVLISTRVLDAEDR